MPARLPVAALALLALLLPASAADARRWKKKAIWGPVTVRGKSQFRTYRRLGARIYAASLDWSKVAPTRPANPRDPSDPAYVWPRELDIAVREARRYRMRIMLNITQAPRWANGGRSAEWSPRNPRDYGRFAAAASRRYPRIRLWQIWSEAARGESFRPMPPGRSTGPRRYARLLDAAYAALKRVRRRNLVIGGNTFVTGDVPALRFLKQMRLTGRGRRKRPRMDLYGHNPFTRRRPRLSDPPLGFGFVDFGTLDTLARRIDRYYPRRRGRRLKLFLSEFSVPTDHRNHVFNFWVSRRTAASWLRSAMRIARRWSRIYALGWYTLYDEPPNRRGDQAPLGLLDYRGRRKPAFRAYQRG